MIEESIAELKRMVNRIAGKRPTFVGPWMAILRNRKVGWPLCRGRNCAEEIRRETYSTPAAKLRSIRALFVGLSLLFVVLGVIR